VIKMPPRENLVGKKFNKLTVIEYVKVPEK
jgi:hypothetical protein